MREQSLSQIYSQIFSFDYKSVLNRSPTDELEMPTRHSPENSADTDNSSSSYSRPNFEWRKLWAYMGPGFLVSIAYVDSGNLDIDIQAGALYAYDLIWTMALSVCLGFLLQYLSLKLGVVTGLGMAELCRLQYSKKTRLTLWLLAEACVILSDMTQVMGSAFALKILFKLPLTYGAIVSFFPVVLLFGVDFAKMRKVEAVVAGLIGIMLVSIVIQFFKGEVSYTEMASGFVPTVPKGSLFLIVALIGSVITPYNLFLHSSLVNTKNIAPSDAAKEEAIFYSSIEFLIALTVCFVINIALISLSAAEFHKSYKSVILMNAPVLLKRLLGSFAPILFALAILASSLSSMITSAISGQYIMQGFLKITVQKSMRALVMRALSVIPSLLIIVFKGEKGADDMIVLSQTVISMLLPFYLIPLIKISSSENIMGNKVNGKYMTYFSSVIAVLVSIANVYVVWITYLEFIEDFSFGKKVLGHLSLTSVSLVYILFLANLLIFNEKNYEYDSIEKNRAGDSVPIDMLLL